LLLQLPQPDTSCPAVGLLSLPGVVPVVAVAAAAALALGSHSAHCAGPVAAADARCHERDL